MLPSFIDASYGANGDDMAVEAHMKGHVKVYEMALTSCGGEYA
jgi:hypothetical protein